MYMHRKPDLEATGSDMIVLEDLERWILEL
jgi:hypothetical protein